MNIIKKIFKRNSEAKEIYNEWAAHLSYLTTVKPDFSVITHISLNEHQHQFYLIYQHKKIFFMEKKINEEMKVLFSDIHNNIKNNEVIWECIKASKDIGVIVPNSSLVGFLVEKLNMYAGHSGITMEDELSFWRQFSIFTQNMTTESIKVPAYTEHHNLWVD